MSEIKLATPIEVDGVTVKALSMREPRVRDMLAAEKAHSDPAQKEIAMFATLCEVAPSALEELTMKDYAKVQQVYSGFLS
ncbi:MAG: phage tail assembly protein [Desulfuromonas sp.]|nr:phage tail assembly protein [Desulfuromonas sp.]